MSQYMCDITSQEIHVNRATECKDLKINYTFWKVQDIYTFSNLEI